MPDLAAEPRARERRAGAAPVYFAFSIRVERMEAERLNAIAHALADLAAREGELRRYL